MAAPYDVRLHPDDARRFAEHGGTLLLLDVPEGTSFGIDQQMFVVGPRFKGLKMLPPGPHFVYYSAANKQGGAAPITGFFTIFKEGQVVVRQWGAREERLAQLKDEDQVERLVAGVKTFQFDSGLGAYDLHKHAAWQTLSGYITEEVARAQEPVGGDICVIFEASVDEKRPKTGAEKKLQEQMQRGRERQTSGDKRKNAEEGGLLDDGSKGVIIMDQGEDRDASAELMEDSSRIDASQVEGPVSRVDQIALMYKRKEASESSNEMDAGGNGSNKAESEAMEIDSQEQSTSSQEKLERQDFAGLRHSQRTLESTPGTSQSASSKAFTTQTEARKAETLGLSSQKVESTSGQATGHKSGRCFYTKLPRLVKQPGMSPSELTALNLDKSAVLETVLSKNYKGREELLLGEMQFAFIAFVMGQSLESFKQWKSMLHLLLGCVEAPLQNRTRLFTQALSVLYWQLRQGLLSGSNRTSGDALLDESWFQRDNFLHHLLTTFFGVLREAQPIEGELKKQADILQALLEKSLGWSFAEGEEGSLENEDDEYAPTLVY